MKRNAKRNSNICCTVPCSFESMYMTRGNEKKYLIAAMFFALLLRVGAFALGYPPIFPDASSYFEAGQALVATGIINNELAMPLYSIVSYIAGGGNYLIAIDIVLSVMTVWGIYLLADCIFNNRYIALLSAIVASIYPFLIFYSISRLSETVFIFLLIFALVFFYKKCNILGDIFIVMSVLVRPTLDLLAPFLVLVFSAIVHREGLKKSFIRLAGYGLIYTLLMAPWWVHNYSKYGEFVRLNLGYGVVLYSGNNPMNKSGGGITDIDYTTKIVGGINDPLLKNKVYAEAGLSYIRENPLVFIKNGLVKFQRFWRLWPYADGWNSPLYVLISVISYGSVLTCAITSIFCLRRAQFIRMSPVFMIIAYLTAVHMVTIGSIRYRLPIEPFLIVLACFALHYLFNWYRKSE